MEADIPNTAQPTSPTDPPQDQPGSTMPGHIAFVLHAVGILLGYGRHLVATVRQRATTPTFITSAAAFGTANIATILAHLNRGILRAAALERVLLERAATGRDITIPTRRTAETPPAPADAQAEPPAAPSPTTKAAPRPTRPTNRADSEFFMPTPEELDRQVRRTSSLGSQRAARRAIGTGGTWDVTRSVRHWAFSSANHRSIHSPRHRHCAPRPPAQPDASQADIAPLHGAGQQPASPP
jgi:hypothetical protein